MSNATATAAAHFARNEDGVEFCSCGFISKFFGDAARHAAKNNEAAPIIDAAVRAVADSRGTVNRRAVAAAALRMNEPASIITKRLDCPRAGDGLAEHEGRLSLKAALQAALDLEGGREALASALDWYEADRKRREAPAAPKREKVVIHAQSALRGQAVKLDAEALAILTAKADRDRAEFGETDLQPVTVEIRDRDDALVGLMTYRL